MIPDSNINQRGVIIRNPIIVGTALLTIWYVFIFVKLRTFSPQDTFGCSISILFITPLFIGIIHAISLYVGLVASRSKRGSIAESVKCGFIFACVLEVEILFFDVLFHISLTLPDSGLLRLLSLLPPLYAHPIAIIYDMAFLLILMFTVVLFSTVGGLGEYMKNKKKD